MQSLQLKGQRREPKTSAPSHLRIRWRRVLGRQRDEPHTETNDDCAKQTLHRQVRLLSAGTPLIAVPALPGHTDYHPHPRLLPSEPWSHSRCWVDWGRWGRRRYSVPMDSDLAASISAVAVEFNFRPHRHRSWTSGQQQLLGSLCLLISAKSPFAFRGKSDLETHISCQSTTELAARSDCGGCVRLFEQQKCKAVEHPFIAYGKAHRFHPALPAVARGEKK